MAGLRKDSNDQNPNSRKVIKPRKAPIKRQVKTNIGAVKRYTRYRMETVTVPEGETMETGNVPEGETIPVDNESNENTTSTTEANSTLMLLQKLVSEMQKDREERRNFEKRILQTITEAESQTGPGISVVDQTGNSVGEILIENTGIPRRNTLE